MKTIFFDLDNTLYDNQQYYLGAFQKVAAYLGKKYKLPPQKIYKKLTELWRKKTSNYPYLFDDLLKELNLSDKQLVKENVRIFNGYRGKLIPFKDARRVLSNFKKQGFKLGIITDGNPKRQAAKLKLLGVKNFFKVIIYTKEIAPKTSKKPFLNAVKKMKIKSLEAYYVGDNPLVDFKGAKACGFVTVRILKGEFKNIRAKKDVDWEIKNLTELIKLIKNHENKR